MSRTVRETSLVGALAAVGLALAVPGNYLGTIGFLIAVFAFAALYRREPGWWAQANVAPWAAALILSAVIVVPQLITESYNRVGAHVSFGVVWWLALAAFLRFVAFMAGRSRTQS